MGQTIKVVLVVAVPVPSLCTLLHVDPIVSTYENVHDPAHKVCRHTASTFSFLDGTPRPVVCSRGGPVPTSLLILLQPARQYFPTSTISPVFIKCSYHFFRFRESVPCAISPLYHNTSRDSSSEPSGASTVSSNQERLSHPMSPQWSKTEVGELNPTLFVTICPTVPTHSLMLPSNKAFSSSQFSAHEFHQTIHTTSGFRSSPVDLDRSTTGLRMKVWGL